MNSKVGIRSIRPLQACHIDHVCVLMQEAQMTPLNRYQIEFLLPEPTCELVGLFEIDDDNDTKDQQPLGITCLMKDGETDFLSLLIVDQRYRRQGIGDKLTRWAVETSKTSTSKPKALTLCASTLGAPVYSKIGFKSYGHARLYKIDSKALQKEKFFSDTKENDMEGRSLVSFFVDSLKDNDSIENHLWRQALQMMSVALKSLENKVSRFSNFVRPFVVHVLYDNQDDNVKILAWCAVGPFSPSSRIIGPIFGKSTKHVMHLVRRVIDQQLNIEKSSDRYLIDAKDSETFYLHTDSQSGQEADFAKNLEADGWEESAKAQWMVYDFGKWNETTKRPTSDTRQFALADFSQG